MANNEQVSQEVKVEETQTVSTEKQMAIKAKEETKKVEKPRKAKKVKKPNKMAKRLKETSSELKKVTWPKFTTVLKQTGVVLAVTAAFLLVVFGIDRLCSWLVGFIV